MPFFLMLVAGLWAQALFAEGYGSFDFMGTGNTVLESAAQRGQTDTNFIATGWTWTGTQYKALISSYRSNDGG